MGEYADYVVDEGIDSYWGRSSISFYKNNFRRKNNLAKSQKFVFSGKAHWSRIFPGQEDSYEDGPSFYKITLEMDEDSKIKYKNSKMKLKFKPVSKDNPAEAITFRRDSEARVFADGGSVGGGPPKIVDADGQPWDMSKAIGNESEVDLLVEQYIPASKPNMVGHRLEAVKVKKHVPYEPLAFEDTFFEDEDSKGVQETPKSTKTKVAQELNDEIPF